MSRYGKNSPVLVKRGVPFDDLKRYPVRAHDPLQAFDSADELILEQLSSEDLSQKKILIVQDQFGALSSRLKESAITVYTDSWVSAQGIRLNTAQAVEPISKLEDLKGPYDLVLLKLPKNLSFFEDILAHLSSHLHLGSKIIIGAMVKHLPAGAFPLIEKWIGKTSTSLAQKKARLIFANFEKKAQPSPYPLSVPIEKFKQPFTHHSNLFSREKLDIGTRFFLEQIPEGEFQTILDLGCANGIVGISAQLKNPQAQLIFSDDSAQALESAKINYKKFCVGDAQFEWTNCYESGPKDSLDLVLCNPPFHQQNAVGDFIAWQMFQDSFRALKKGGLIRVIGNGHLQYPQKLKKIFGNSKIIATNSKFVIVDAVR